MEDSQILSSSGSLVADARLAGASRETPCGLPVVAGSRRWPTLWASGRRACLAKRHQLMIHMAGNCATAVFHFVGRLVPPTLFSFFALLMALAVDCRAADFNLDTTINREDVLLERLLISKLIADQRFLQGESGSGTGSERACSCKEALIVKCAMSPATDDGSTSPFAPLWRDRESLPKGDKPLSGIHSFRDQRLHGIAACVDVKLANGACAPLPWALGAAPKKTVPRDLNLNEACPAWLAYQVVRDNAKLLASSSFGSLQSTEKQNVIRLVSLDAEYRQVLIEHELPFWGGVFALEPGIPTRIRDEAKALLLGLTTQSQEISQRIVQQQTWKAVAQSALADLKQAEGDVRKAQQSQAIQRYNRAESARVGAFMAQQASELGDLYKEIETDISQVRKERDAAANALNTAILSAAASSVGIPPDAVTAMQSGDSGSILKSVVGAALAGNIDTSTPLGSLQEDLKKATENQELVVKGLEIYRQVQQVQATTQSIAGLAKTAGELLEHPSLDSLAKLGTSLRDTCTQASVHDLCADVEASASETRAAILKSVASPETVSKVQDLYEKVQNLQSQGAKLPALGLETTDLLRTPSLDRLRAVGNSIQNICAAQTSNATCAQAATLVAKSPPVFDVLERARRVTAITLSGDAKEVCKSGLDALTQLAEATRHLSAAAVPNIDPAACGVIDLAEDPIGLCGSNWTGPTNGSLQTWMENHNVAWDPSVLKQTGADSSVLRDSVSRACQVQHSLVMLLVQSTGIDRYLSVWIHGLDAAATNKIFLETLNLVWQEPIRQNSQLVISLVEAAVRARTHEVIEALLDRAGASRDAALAELSVAIGIPRTSREEDVTAAVAERGLSHVAGLVIDANGIKIALNSRTSVALTLREIKDAFDSAPQLSAADARLAPLLRNAVLAALAQHGSLREVLLARIPMDVQEQILHSIMAEKGGSRSSSIAVTLWKAVRSPAEEHQAAALLLGEAAVAEATRERAPTVPEASSPSSRNTRPKQSYSRRDASAAAAQQQMMAKMALNYAFPGAGVAIDAVGAFFTMNEAQSRLERLANERFHTTLMISHAHEAAYHALRDAEVARLEEQIADITRQTAQDRTEVYRASILGLEGSSEFLRRQALIRRPLAFYYGEKLRETYARLDQSMGLWMGQERRPGREIQRLIQDNPQNLYLATDSEINLFDWFRTDIEGQRTDVDSMMIHWREKLALVDRICFESGCQPGNGAFGAIQDTGLLHLNEIAGDVQWRHFKTWQSSNTASPFTFRVLLHPGLEGFRDQAVNQRVVLARAGFVIHDQIVAPRGESLALGHPGYAVVPTLTGESPPRVKLQREYLLPRNTSSFDAPDSFVLASVRERWGRPGDYYPDTFEGYGLFTAWSITIAPTVESRTATNIVLRFAYTATDTSQIHSERELLQALQSRDERLLQTPSRIWTWGWRGIGSTVDTDLDSEAQASSAQELGLTDPEGERIRQRYAAALFGVDGFEATQIMASGQVAAARNVDCPNPVHCAPTASDGLLGTVEFKVKVRSCDQVRAAQKRSWIAMAFQQQSKDGIDQLSDVNDHETPILKVRRLCASLRPAALGGRSPPERQRNRSADLGDCASAIAEKSREDFQKEAAIWAAIPNRNRDSLDGTEESRLCLE
jgi:hypothetical protein